MRVDITYILGVFMMLCICSCSSEETLTGESPVERTYQLETHQYKIKRGVDQNLFNLDVYHSGTREDLRPVIIYVHGGGWTSGDKTTNLQNKMRLARELDYILVSINYRLSPFPYELDNPERVHFPAHNRDAADAIKWIYDNISQYGGDISKMGLIGHSAGAQLVSLLGTNEIFMEKVGLTLSDLKFVIAVDTRGYDVAKQIAEGASPDLYMNAFTKDERFHELASPLFNISRGKNIPAFFIAKRGGIQRIIDANEFINKLKAADVKVASVDGSVYDHGGINRAIGGEDETVVTPPIVEFLIGVLE